MWWIVKTTLRKVLCWVCQWFFLNWWIFGIGKIQAKRWLSQDRIMAMSLVWFLVHPLHKYNSNRIACIDWLSGDYSVFCANCVTTIQVPLFILPCFSIEEPPANETSSRETTSALKYTHVAVCYVHCHLSHHCGNSELTCHTGSVLPATRQRWHSQPKLVLNLATAEGCKDELT